MLHIKKQPVDKMLFYAIGFSVFDSCCYDYDESNPWIAFVKEITGANPGMRVLMEEMLKQGYLVENG